MKEPPSKSERVLLIHGTFAHSSHDEGGAWWQRGSAFWRKLHARLLGMAELDEAFHWSGENTERARHLSAQALLARLLEMERQSQPYHLIAHSHGGSVVWQALKLSVDVERLHRHWPQAPVGLRFLRSWATVGTPFMKIRAASHLTMLASVLGSLLTVIGFCLTFLVVLVAAVSLPIFGDFELVGYLGSPLFILAMIACGVVMLTIGVPLMVPGIEGVYAGMENELESRAWENYSATWLGLWNVDDEAINGLRTTLHLRGRIAPRLAPCPAVFHGEQWTRLTRPLMTLLYWAFNRFISPAVDRFVWNQLARAFQGNDRPGAVLGGVSTAPGPEINKCPPLPEDICAALRSSANEAARHCLPQIRSLLGQAALGGGLGVMLGGMDGQLTDQALVHTSYFDNEQVCEMLALHIARRSERQPD